MIPQLIARIDHHSPNVQKLLNSLLARVAAAHPQALIYPLAVTSNTASEARRLAAHVIIRSMAASNRRLVDEANLVRALAADGTTLWQAHASACLSPLMSV